MARKQRNVEKWLRKTQKENWVNLPSVAVDSQDTTAIPAGARVFDIDAGVAGTLGNEGSIQVSEIVDGFNHRVVLTLTGVVFDTIGDGATIAVGEPLYVIPAGAAIVKDAYINIALTNKDGNVDADTPDVGLGTTVASGAVAVLSGTSAFENVLTGQTAGDCDGADIVKTVSNQILTIETGDSHTVFLNVADTFAAGGESALTANGVVVIDYVKVY